MQNFKQLLRKSMSNTLLLFDIDYTLFDTTRYKKTVAKELAQIANHLDEEKVYQNIEEVYYDVRSFGSFDPSLFADIFIKKFPDNLSREAVESVWWRKDILVSSLYPEVIPTLKILSKKENLQLGIFSSGKTDFQLAKISHIEDFFHKGNIHIASFKEETIGQLVEEYKTRKLLLVDDYVEILESVKKQKPDTTTIWMKRGKFAEKAQIPEGFEPDGIITTLGELTEIVDKAGID